MRHSDFLTSSFLEKIDRRILEMAEIKCNVVKKIAVLSEKDNGYSKQLNLIAWNDREAKLDIREWSPADRAIKGITLTDEEAKNLLKALNNYFNEAGHDAKN